MHDAVQCEEAGVPAGIVVTNALQGFAASAAGRLGMPGHPYAVVEHPIFTRDRAWMQRTGEMLADVLARQLLTDRSTDVG